MNKKIYSLIIGVLAVSILFLVIKQNRTTTKKNSELSKLQEQLSQKNDSLQLVKKQYEDASSFLLSTNPDAKELLYNQGITGDVNKLVLEALFKTNDTATNNPLVPYEGTMGGVMKINNARVLNNKWVIADYSDGYFWGEILLEYQIDKQGKIQFKPFNELLYPHR